jgi:hypothetical protein
MTHIEFAAKEMPNSLNSVRIVARGPRISPRDAYAADHVIVDSRNVFRRPVEWRSFPSITVHGAPT